MFVNLRKSVRIGLRDCDAGTFCQKSETFINQLAKASIDRPGIADKVCVTHRGHHPLH